MGMSASQVRFLSLQNRKNTIGHELMTLSNRKLALSRDMNNVANNYTNALNQIRLKWSPDGGINYYNLNYDLLMKPNDLNAETPYIVTDKFGRVVVDDKEFTLTNSSGSEKYDCKSYKYIAELISKYSRTTADGDVEYENESYVNTTNNTGKPTSDADAYYISKNFGQFNFSDAFRIDLFKEMGLISDEQVEQYKALLAKLYGPIAVKCTSNYDGLLEQFDHDKTLTLNVDGKSIVYGDVFGNLTCDHSNGNFLDLDGGCAYGNLQLAKAYRDEYKAFLNTTFKHDILVNTDSTIALTHAGSTDALDLSNFTGVDGYRYNGKDSTGISFRTVDLLAKVSDHDISTTGSTVTYKSRGLMDNLSFYSYDESNDRYIAYTNLHDMYGDYEFDPIPHITYDINNGDTDDYYKDIASIETWDQLYDQTGNLRSYDKNNDGYFVGKDYNNTKNVSIAVRAGSSIDNDPREQYITSKLGVDVLIDTLANSAKTIENINERAVNYAAAKTKEFYIDNYTDEGTDDRENGGSYYPSKFSRNIFGLGWVDANGGGTQGYGDRYPLPEWTDDVDDDFVSISATHLINAFWTFYAMYDSVDRELGGTAASNDIDARLHDSVFGENSQVYQDAVYDALGAGDKGLAKCVACMSDLTTALAEYIDKYDTNRFSSEHLVSGDPTPGIRTLQYSKPNNDGSLSTRTITGEWNGTRFISVTSIEDKIDNNTVRKLGVVGTGANAQLEEVQYIKSSGLGYDTKNIVKYKQGTGDFQNSALVYVGGPDESYSFGGALKPITGADGSVVSNTIAVYNNSGNTSISNLYYGDLNHKFTNLAISGLLTTKGASCYILKEGSGIEKDTNYNYQLDKGSVANSVFASTIYLKPEDKYSKILDDLVAKCQQEVDNLERDLENCFTGFQTRMMEYFDALFKRISKNGWVLDSDLDGSQRSDDYLNSMLQNNQYYITEAKDIDSSNYYKFTMKQATSCNTIYQVHDSDAEEKALAEYTAKKTAISIQEKKVDRRMKILETEQEAINTELESVKKVKEENIEKFFKIFA